MAHLTRRPSLELSSSQPFAYLDLARPTSERSKIFVPRRKQTYLSGRRLLPMDDIPMTWSSAPPPSPTSSSDPAVPSFQPSTFTAGSLYDCQRQQYIALATATESPRPSELSLQDNSPPPSTKVQRVGEVRRETVRRSALSNESYLAAREREQARARHVALKPSTLFLLLPFASEAGVVETMLAYAGMRARDVRSFKQWHLLPFDGEDAKAETQSWERNEGARTKRTSLVRARLVPSPSNVRGEGHSRINPRQRQQPAFKIPRKLRRSVRRRLQKERSCQAVAHWSRRQQKQQKQQKHSQPSNMQPSKASQLQSSQPTTGPSTSPAQNFGALASLASAIITAGLAGVAIEVLQFITPAVSAASNPAGLSALTRGGSAGAMTTGVAVGGVVVAGAAVVGTMLSGGTGRKRRRSSPGEDATIAKAFGLDISDDEQDQPALGLESFSIKSAAGDKYDPIEIDSTDDDVKSANASTSKASSAKAVKPSAMVQPKISTHFSSKRPVPTSRSDDEPVLAKKPSSAKPRPSAAKKVKVVESSSRKVESSSKAKGKGKAARSPTVTNTLSLSKVHRPPIGSQSVLKTDLRIASELSDESDIGLTAEEHLLQKFGAYEPKKFVHPVRRSHKKMSDDDYDDVSDEPDAVKGAATRGRSGKTVVEDDEDDEDDSKKKKRAPPKPSAPPAAEILRTDRLLLPSMWSTLTEQLTSSAPSRSDVEACIYGYPPGSQQKTRDGTTLYDYLTSPNGLNVSPWPRKGTTGDTSYSSVEDIHEKLYQRVVTICKAKYGDHPPDNGRRSVAAVLTPEAGQDQRVAVTMRHPSRPITSQEEAEVNVLLTKARDVLHSTQLAFLKRCLVRWAPHQWLGSKYFDKVVRVVSRLDGAVALAFGRKWLELDVRPSVADPHGKSPGTELITLLLRGEQPPTGFDPCSYVSLFSQMVEDGTITVPTEGYAGLACSHPRHVGSLNQRYRPDLAPSERRRGQLPRRGMFGRGLTPPDFVDGDQASSGVSTGPSGASSGAASSKLPATEDVTDAADDASDAAEGEDEDGDDEGAPTKVKKYDYNGGAAGRGMKRRFLVSEESEDARRILWHKSTGTLPLINRTADTAMRAHPLFALDRNSSIDDLVLELVTEQLLYTDESARPINIAPCGREVIEKPSSLAKALVYDARVQSGLLDAGPFEQIVVIGEGPPDMVQGKKPRYISAYLKAARYPSASDECSTEISKASVTFLDVTHKPNNYSAALDAEDKEKFFDKLFATRRTVTHLAVTDHRLDQLATAFEDGPWSTEPGSHGKVIFTNPKTAETRPFSWLYGRTWSVLYQNCAMSCVQSREVMMNESALHVSRAAYPVDASKRWEAEHKDLIHQIATNGKRWDRDRSLVHSQRSNVNFDVACMDVFPVEHEVGKGMSSTFRLPKSSFAADGFVKIATRPFRSSGKWKGCYFAGGSRLKYRIDHVLGQFFLVPSVATPRDELAWDSHVKKEVRDGMIKKDGTLQAPCSTGGWRELMYPLENVHNGLLLQRMQEYVKNAGGVDMLPYE